MDYFRLEVRHAGILRAQTSGEADTHGQLWQVRQTLALVVEDNNSGAGLAFRLGPAVPAGTYYLAVSAGSAGPLGAYTLEVDYTPGLFENPPPTSFQSGVSLISGWVCEAEVVEIELTNGTTGEVQTAEAAYGTSRADTRGACGDADNGFGLLYNWNLLGDGTHTVRAVMDGIELARRTITVTTLGEEFARGLSGHYLLPDFPHPGEEVFLHWSEARQNFVLGSATLPVETGTDWPGDGQVGFLENPASHSVQSGVSVISGWVCEAEVVEIELTNGTTGEMQTAEAAYGTSRVDTRSACGDASNGFGLLYNWNLLGDGTHTVQVIADGVELGYATVTVTTLGEEFVREVRRVSHLPDFPAPDWTVTVEWQEAHQNFTITGVE